jgi:uncharacterized protein YtpQ (UPF0354 family)
MNLIKQSYDKKMEDLKQTITASYERKIEQTMRSILSRYERQMQDMKQTLLVSYNEKITEMKEHHEESINEMKDLYESIRNRHHKNMSDDDDNEDGYIYEHEEMNVSGCGIADINGIYKNIGHCDEVPKYSKTGR